MEIPAGSLTPSLDGSIDLREPGRLRRWRSIRLIIAGTGGVSFLETDVCRSVTQAYSVTVIVDGSGIAEGRIARQILANRYWPPIGSLIHRLTWRCGARTNYSGH